MNQAGKKKFVAELSKAVTMSVLTDIVAGRIPEDWDGVELRELLSNRFSDATYPMSVARMRKYRNDILEYDL